MARYAKISENISKVEALFSEGDQSPEKMEKLIQGLNKYSDALSEMLDEIYEDDQVDEEEENKLNELDEQIQKILEQFQAQNFMNEENTEAAHLAEIKAKFVNYVKEFKTAFLEAQKLAKDATV